MVRFSRTAPAGALLCFVTACLFPEYTFNETEPSGGSATGGGGSGAGNAGAGGSGAGGGEGGSGGILPPTEDCLVAGDEDDDGLEDCADPDCAPDVECVDAIPVGWGTFGYTALFRGSPASDPDCPAGTSTDVYTGNGNLLNTDADCTTCDCDTPIDRLCELVDDFDVAKSGLQFIYTRDVPCGVGVATNQTTLTTPAGWDGTCSGVDVAPGGGACPGANCNKSVRVQAADVTGGSCMPLGGEPSGGDPTWGEAVKACRAETTLGGCDTGKTCVLRPKAPFEPRICVGKSGDQACPAGFPLPSDAFSDFDDDRMCSMCTCGDPTGGVCKVTVDLFSDNPTACTTALVSVESGGCQDVTGNPRVSGRTSSVTTQPTGGGCNSTGGGVPSGEATPTGQTTFCCLPSE